MQVTVGKCLREVYVVTLECVCERFIVGKDAAPRILFCSYEMTWVISYPKPFHK